MGIGYECEYVVLVEWDFVVGGEYVMYFGLVL